MSSSLQSRNFDLDKNPPQVKHIKDPKNWDPFSTNLSTAQKFQPEFHNNDQDISSTKHNNNSNQKGSDSNGKNKTSNNTSNILITEVPSQRKNADSNNKINEYIQENENKKKSERENYLKTKLNSMEITKDVKTGVVKGITKTTWKIHDEISKDTWVVSNDPKEINEWIPSWRDSFDKVSNSLNLIPEQFRQLKHLKASEEYYKNTIFKLDQNKALIEAESIKGIKNSIIEANIRVTQLKTIKFKKDTCIQKLDEISWQIETILNAEHLTKKERIANFLENFEKEKEEFEAKVLKYEEQSLKAKEKMINDLHISKEKRIKQLELKEKEEELKRKEELRKHKEKGVELFKTRKKERDALMEKTNKYIKEKLNKDEKSYRHVLFKEKYEAEEQKVYEKYKMMKKDPWISKEELTAFKLKIKDQEELLKQEASEKKKQLNEMWQNRVCTLPEYKCPLAEVLEKEAMEKQVNEKMIKEQLIIKVKEREKYCEKIPWPKVDENLKKIRIKRLGKLTKEDNMETRKQNKKRQMLIDIPPPKPKLQSSSDGERINGNSTNISMRTEKQIINILSKKPKRYTAPKHELKPIPEKPINYLTEFRGKREALPNKGIQIKKKWDLNSWSTEHLGRQGGNINAIENLQMAKIQADVWDSKFEQKKQWMKINGGYWKNPEWGDEVGDWLIESIKAKLGIMSKLNRNKVSEVVNNDQEELSY